MKINKTEFFKGLFVGCIALGFAVIASSLYKYSVFAQGGSDCSQNSNCNLLDGPGNQGNYALNENIAKIVIKAGQNYFTFNQTANDGCYSVNISGNSLSWQRVGDGSNCQDISHIQLWSEENQVEVPNTPNFPSCESKIFTADGDRAHYEYGVHGIPGVGNLEGSDDVYSLDSNNFLQCYCPVEGESGQPAQSGIQSNWWNVSNLSQDQISSLQGDGWLFETSGLLWNLFDDPYLVKNDSFSCTQVTPTPTETPVLTPTPTVTPTITSTPTPTTPTPDDEPESRCSGLSISPSEGTAPLTVRANGSGFDESGKIQRYKFDFGDTSDGQPQVWEQDGSEAAHRYVNPGTYTISLHVKDSRGNWRNGQSDCKKTVTVKAKPQVLGLGGSTVTELPKTGGSLWFGISLITAGTSGLYLYRRFRLV